jgi:hypothetical protein
VPDTTANAIAMRNKTTALIGAAACAGLIVTFVPGFARELATAVVPSGKLHSGTKDRAAVMGPADPGCSPAPWPYGCNWHASAEPKHIAKRIHDRRHHDVMTSYLSPSGNLKEE